MLVGCGSGATTDVTPAGAALQFSVAGTQALTETVTYASPSPPVKTTTDYEESFNFTAPGDSSFNLQGGSKTLSSYTDPQTEFTTTETLTWGSASPSPASPNDPTLPRAARPSR